jgi:hypothetical protein
VKGPGGVRAPPPRCDWALEVAVGRDGHRPVFRATCADTGDVFFGDTTDAVWHQLRQFAPTPYGKNPLLDSSDKQGALDTRSTCTRVGDDFFGFSKLAIRQVLERLPDAAGCASYAFAAVRRTEAHTPAASSSGCARSEPYVSRDIRESAVAGTGAAVGGSSPRLQMTALRSTEIRLGMRGSPIAKRVVPDDTTESFADTRVRRIAVLSLLVPMLNG